MRDITLTLMGDLILDAPNPDHWLSGLRATIGRSDLTIGHLEVPHTVRGTERQDDIPAPAAPPEHLHALKRLGIDAVTLAGNHIMDRGPLGAFDTMTELDRLGIGHCGLGPTIHEARAPLILRRSGVRIGLLSYNCVGPESSWATATRPGCAFIRITPEGGGPVTPAAALHHVDAPSLQEAVTDIRAARDSSDVLIVALHKGIVHRPAELAPYEITVSRALIDAGADVVIGHHAHIVKGIEFYRGRPIYHGLGNGCVVTRALSLSEAHPKRAEWARRRRELFGFEPDPRYELAPFHPEAIHAFVARLHYIDGELKTGIIPLHVEPPGRPVPPTQEEARRTVQYLADITVRAGLPAVKCLPDHEMVHLQQ